MSPLLGVAAAIPFFVYALFRAGTAWRWILDESVEDEKSEGEHKEASDETSEGNADETREDKLESGGVD